MCLPRSSCLEGGSVPVCSWCWGQHPGGTEVTPAPVSPELLRAPELPPDAPQGLQGGPEEVPHQEPDLGRGEEQEGDVQSAQEALRAAGTCKDCPAWGLQWDSHVSLGCLLPGITWTSAPRAGFRLGAALGFFWLRCFTKMLWLLVLCDTPRSPREGGDSLVGLGSVSALPGNCSAY